MTMTGLERVRQRLQEVLEVNLADTPIDLVVMGPDPKEGSPAARLRSQIVDAAVKYGVAVKPEHRSLTDTAKAALKAGHHLTAYEMHLVEACHLVILIPDSAGSLCELGLFSSYKEASCKMVVLVNAVYPRKGSYVAEGPLAAAQHNLAEIHYIDYNDFDEAWRAVEARIQRVQAERSMANLMAGRV